MQNEINGSAAERREGNDRRVNNIPVEEERRSGIDRRAVGLPAEQELPAQPIVNEAYGRPVPPPMPPYCPPDGRMPHPGMRPPCPPSPRRLSRPARVLLWILGVIVGVTIVFGCAVFWIFGINYVYGAVSGQVGSAADSQQAPNGNEFFFYYPDGSGGYSNTDPTPPDGGSAQSSPKAGLGVTVGQLELEFVVDGGYDCGLLIMSINDNSAFIGTDVRVNDLIVAADGATIETIDELSAVLDSKKPGDKVTFTIARYENGVADTFSVTVTLIELEG